LRKRYRNGEKMGKEECICGISVFDIARQFEFVLEHLKADEITWKEMKVPPTSKINLIELEQDIWDLKLDCGLDSESLEYKYLLWRRQRKNWKKKTSGKALG